MVEGADPTDAVEARVEARIERESKNIYDRVTLGLNAEREFSEKDIATVIARIDGMDRAVTLLAETVNRVPTELQLAIEHARSLNDEKFSSVQTQFTERDTRSERESRDNKVAVDAAFAAQKEAAAKQDEANQKAIDKSEAATAETINKLTELFNTTIRALGETVNDVKLRVGNMEAVVANARFNQTDNRMSQANIIALIGVIILGAAALIGFHK